jgi:hypothetical protein
VEIQRQQGDGWKTIKRLNAGGNRVFTGKVRVRGKAKLRAQASGEASLAWKLAAG